MRLLAAIAVASVLAAPIAASADTLNLSTGAYNSYSVLAPPASQNQNPNQFTNAPDAVFITPNAGWGAQINGASWIGLPNSGTTNYPGGLYEYFTGVFSGYYSLSGSFASDNAAGAYIFDATTGVSTLLAGNTYGTGPSDYSFNTVTGFSTSLNPTDSYRLVFAVMNGNGTTDTQGPTGLLAGASAISATPEPSSLALLGTGIAGVAGFARRRLRRA